MFFFSFFYIIIIIILKIKEEKKFCFDVELVLDLILNKNEFILMSSLLRILHN
jgi:hypothetical protein